MADRCHDLTSDPAAEHLADPVPDEARLAASDARSGGDPRHAPRSLQQAELEPDDEDVAGIEDWDDEDRL
jgi:hypothetical protein